MPHIILEYSRPLEKVVAIEKAMDIVFEASVATSTMNAADVKIRALPYDHYRLEGGITSFLHVTVKLLSGRTPAQKESISVALRAALAEAFPMIESISIDLRDMDPDAYKKRVL